VAAISFVEGLFCRQWVGASVSVLSGFDRCRCACLKFTVAPCWIGLHFWRAAQVSG
jgi:hypothetical protein